MEEQAKKTYEPLTGQFIPEELFKLLQGDSNESLRDRTIKRIEAALNHTNILRHDSHARAIAMMEYLERRK